MRSEAVPTKVRTEEGSHDETIAADSERFGAVRTRETNIGGRERAGWGAQEALARVLPEWSDGKPTDDLSMLSAVVPPAPRHQRP